MKDQSTAVAASPELVSKVDPPDQGTFDGWSSLDDFYEPVEEQGYTIHGLARPFSNFRGAVLIR